MAGERGVQQCARCVRPVTLLIPAAANAPIHLDQGEQFAQVRLRSVAVTSAGAASVARRTLPRTPAPTRPRPTARSFRSQGPRTAVPIGNLDRLYLPRFAIFGHLFKHRLAGGQPLTLEKQRNISPRHEHRSHGFAHVVHRCAAVHFPRRDPPRPARAKLRRNLRIATS